MSNYTQVVFFAPKDTLLTGNPAKVIKGAEVDPELAAIAAAIATKLDSSQAANPTGTVKLTATNGVAATYMRSDGAPALDVTIAPIWSGLHTFVPGAAIATVVLGDTLGHGTAIKLLGSSAAQGKNWLIGNQNNATDTLEFTPSTANGGSTFTTPALKIAGAGNVTIAAPSSGEGLTVTAVANGDAINVLAPNTASQSFGVQIKAGTNSTDYSLNAVNAANTTTYFRVRGDGLTQAVDQAGTLQDVGWRDCPINSQASGYTLVLADRGKLVSITGAGTLTIPANSGTPFPVGATIMIFANGALTISITTDTLVLAATGTTGSRTLAVNGLASLVKISATVWVITGAGVS